MALVRTRSSARSRLLPRPVRSSLIDGCGVLDAWMLKVAHYMLGKMKQPPHEFLNMRTHFGLVVRQASRMDLPLEVVVQILVRVQLRRITRQVDHFHPFPIRSPPPLP